MIMHANVDFCLPVKLLCFQNAPILVIAWYSMETCSKDNKVDFNTFKKWGKDNIIGYKTIEEGVRKFVNFVWCKVCTHNKDSYHKRFYFCGRNCKGSIKTAIKAYTDGTQRLRLKQYLNVSVPSFVIKNTDMTLYSHRN